MTQWVLSVIGAQHPDRKGFRIKPGPGSYGRRNGYQNPHVRPGPYAVRLGDVANQNIAGLGGQGFVFVREEVAIALNDKNADLALDVVGVNGQFLAWLEVEIQDFEVGGIMHEKPLHGKVVKVVFLE
jgi:hypothetical protein